MATAIVRFFVRHAIDFRAAESKLFADLLESAAISQGTNERIDQGFADSKKLQHCSGVPERYTIPHGNALQAFWEHSPAAQFVDTDLSNIGEFPSSRYLIIYFPDYANAQPSRHALRRQPTEDEGNSGEASMIASTFLWTSGAKLYYIGSRNCSHDFKSCIAELVLQSKETCKLGKAALDQVFIGRPFETSEQSADVTKNDPVNTWISDVPREVDILAQQLLTQVPVLSRCVRRNTLLASFFRETYSSRAAVMLFGRNLAEKEQCARYKAHIALPLQLTRCCDAVENAQQTFKILSHAQSSHKDRQRFQETSSFLHTINEESAGNVQLCQEITRLVLSQPYLNELEIFIAVMKPLAKLIEKYTCVDDSLSASDMGSSAPLASGGRSLAHVLPDCFSTLRDIYKEQRPELENDLRLLRAMSARRLMGQGGDEYPPIVGDICYLATFLNPTSNLAAMKGITVDESWRRAVSFLHFQYGSRSDVVLDRAIEQLQDFHQRSGAFAEPGIFIAPDETEQEDPRIWWQKHGRLAPDLFTIALKVLDAPTAAFPIVKLASEMNGRHSDLYSTEKDELMEKKRFLLWNLRLSERADTSKNVDSFLGPPHSKGES
ncbi:unnamed protein product [Chondrus crispus]|uniref:Uncharacterized protein n=1 Tax=Chondrus crispus TaxID=2769 RepID=R7QS45_CHOCR|nr:unnamed protein product [Chondrus crispus]CDF40939.1 unnamed protein product [Chondrus crispus]|eukprot:XP_005711233.1 unnamed protein product [Chondrus crispus]